MQPKQFVATTKSDHKLEVYLNLAGRMKLTGIDQLWVADITYIRLRAEFVYLAVILDRFSRKVVGWCLAANLGQPLSDRGVGAGDCETAARAGPGTSLGSRRAIRQRRIRSDPGKAWHDSEHEPSGQPVRHDNASCESFMKTLKGRRSMRTSTMT